MSDEGQSGAGISAHAGFLEKVHQEANAEAERIVSELGRLRAEATEVVQVLNALSLEVPAELMQFTGSAPARPAPKPAPRQAPSQPPAKAAAEPAPAPPPAPVAPVREHPGEPSPPRVVVRSGSVLAQMPAFSRPRTSPALKRETAHYQLNLIEGAQKLGRPFLTSELAPFVLTAEQQQPANLRNSLARMKGNIEALIQAGYIATTGVTRRAAGQTAGRYGTEYRLVRLPTGSLAPTNDQPTAQEMVVVRNWATSQSPDRLFGVGEVAVALDMKPQTVLNTLVKLAAQDIVMDESPTSDLRLFRYERPKEPGRGFEMDERRRAQGLPVGGGGGNGGGAPVAGTGGRLRATNPDVQRMLDACRQAGATVEHASNGHFSVLPRGGGRKVLISSTPHNQRSVLNDRARLRRAGIPV